MAAQSITHRDRLQRNQDRLSQYAEDIPVRFVTGKGVGMHLMSDNLPNADCQPRSLLLSQPVVADSILQQASTYAESTTLILLADHFAHIERYAAIASQQTPIAVRVQIESSAIGFGSRPGLDCLMLAKAIQQSPRLTFDGIQLNINGTSERDSPDVHNAVGTLMQTADLLLKNNIQNFVEACNHIDVCRQLHKRSEWLCEFGETNSSIFQQRFGVELNPVYELKATVISRPQLGTAVVDLERSQYDGRNQLRCETGIRITRSFADHCVVNLHKSARELFIGDEVSFFVL